MLKKQIKKAGLLILATIFLITMIGFALGSITSNTPTSGGEVSGTYIFNATVTGVNNASFCTWATTADGVFANTSNTTGEQTEYTNTSITTTTLTDASSTTLTINCSNATGDGSEATTLTIIVNNTQPTCSCTLDRKIIHLHDQLGYDCTGSTGASTYSAVATYEDATTETETNAVGYFEETRSLGEGSVLITVTDAEGLVNSCTAIDFTIVSDDEDISELTSGIFDDKKKVGAFIGLLVLIFGAIGISVHLMNKK